MDKVYHYHPLIDKGCFNSAHPTKHHTPVYPVRSRTIITEPSNNIWNQRTTMGTRPADATAHTPPIPAPDLYNEIGAAYETAFAGLPEQLASIKWLGAQLENVRPEKVLDVGCGHRSASLFHPRRCGPRGSWNRRLDGNARRGAEISPQREI